MLGVFGVSQVMLNHGGSGGLGGHGEGAGAAEQDVLSGKIVDAGLRVHRTLGPGLLETVYEQCLAYELQLRGVRVQRQVSVPVVYNGVVLDVVYRLDLLVGECIVVEVKSVDALTGLHAAQVLTYLKLSGHRVGFLMNFNVELFKQGVRRLVL